MQWLWLKEVMVRSNKVVTVERGGGGIERGDGGVEQGGGRSKEVVVLNEVVVGQTRWQAIVVGSNEVVAVERGGGGVWWG